MIPEPIPSDSRLSAFAFLLLLLFVCLPFEQNGPWKHSLSPISPCLGPRLSLYVLESRPNQESADPVWERRADPVRERHAHAQFRQRPAHGIRDI